MRAFLVAAAILAVAPAYAAEPAAAKGPVLHYAWELDLFVGYGQLAWPWPDSSQNSWANGGPAIAIDVAYRGDHFTHPFVELAYVPILASGRVAYIPGSNSTMSTSSSTNALALVLGVGWDIDWFRLRAGFGIYDVMVKTTVDGATNSTSQLGLGFQAAAAAMIWQPGPFAVGVEGKIIGLETPLNGFYQMLYQVGLAGRWDFVRN